MSWVAKGVNPSHPINSRPRTKKLVVVDGIRVVGVVVVVVVVVVTVVVVESHARAALH